MVACADRTARSARAAAGAGACRWTSACLGPTALCPHSQQGRGLPHELLAQTCNISEQRFIMSSPNVAVLAKRNTRPGYFQAFLGGINTIRHSHTILLIICDVLDRQVDRLSQEQLPALEQLGEQLRGMYPFAHTFAISARHGHGVPELRDFLLQQCAPPFMFAHR